MLGTFGGALEARQIDASNGKLVAEVTGEVEAEDGVLVIRRIHVIMQLVASEDSRCTTQSSSRPLIRWSLCLLHMGLRAFRQPELHRLSKLRSVRG